MKYRNRLLVWVIALFIASILFVTGLGILFIKSNNIGVTNREVAKLICALDGRLDIDNTYVEYCRDNIFDIEDEFEYLSRKQFIKIAQYYGYDKKLLRELNFSWYAFLDYLITDKNLDHIEKKQLTIIGTPGNLDMSADDVVYTTDGRYRFTSLYLDGYCDTIINAYVVKDEIVGIEGIESSKVIYENVWIYNGDNNRINCYIEGLNRTFIVNGLTSPVKDVLGDISVDNQNVISVKVKTDTIKGKVLAVGDTYIEIEGYGKVPLHNNARIYNNYKEFKQITSDSILVGYDRQDFIVADGKICGAVIVAPFNLKDIRVMIRNTGFESIYHDNIVLSSKQGIKIYYGEDLKQVRQLEPDESIELLPNDELIDNKRIRLEPLNGGRIVIESIERSQGNPAYPGIIEISSDDKGIYVVNEVDMEQYLKLVVPSEMPAYYGVEAAKVQAICARSYAYNQLLKNDYKEYGAHIDDSTWYQVYNNTEEYNNSTNGVEATKGLVLTSNGEVITAYYYSTSCGHSTRTDVWGSNPDNTPYATAHTINSKNEYIDLTSNESFYNYIKNINEEDYEKDFSLYRWGYELSMEEINRIYKEKAGVGDIKSIEITKRVDGGAVVEALITGSKGEYVVKGEMAARKFFGDKSIDMVNNNGKIFNMASLPSANFALVPVMKNDKLLGYKLLGGGFGHGIGMSQNGAYGMSKLGYSYEDILRFFYTGVEITSLFSMEAR